MIRYSVHFFPRVFIHPAFSTLDNAMKLMLLSPKFTRSDGYSMYVYRRYFRNRNDLPNRMQRAVRFIVQLTRCEYIFTHSHTEVRAAFSASCRNEYFCTPKHNSPRDSRHFSEPPWKLIRFYFGNLDTHCLPAILLLFHPSRSFSRVPFVLVTHCQKHARNEISITFFIPSRTYIHFNFTSSLWYFPFFLLSCFIYLFSFDFGWNRHRYRRCLTSTSHVTFRRDDKRVNKNCSSTLYS